MHTIFRSLFFQGCKVIHIFKTKVVGADYVLEIVPQLFFLFCPHCSCCIMLLIPHILSQQSTILCNCSTLDLLALIPFKLQNSQLVSLWKSSHSGYKKWYCHFYTCQINKGDIWLQFENNEKNPPGGAVIQKNQKQILKSWYLHYWRAPRGARGVKRCARIY